MCFIIQDFLWIIREEAAEFLTFVDHNSFTCTSMWVQTTYRMDEWNHFSCLIRTWPYVTTERLVWSPFDALFTALCDSPFWSCWFGSCVRSQAPPGSVKLLSAVSHLFFCGEAKGLKSSWTLRCGCVLNSVSKEDSCWVTPRSPPTSTLRITQITSVETFGKRKNIVNQAICHFYIPVCTNIDFLPP